AQAPTFTQIWLSRGAMEQDPAKKAELYGRAEAAVRTWLASAPDADKVRAKTTLANLLLRQKRYDDAIPLIEELKAGDPANCSARLELARAYLGKEDYPKARAAAADAVECQPAEPQGYLLRATAAYAADDCPAVVKDGAEYAKRAPNRGEP